MRHSPWRCATSHSGKRSARHTIENTLDPAIKVLARDIQQHICQGSARPVEDPARLPRPPTNLQRYWSFLRKQGGKISKSPPNISIAFEGKNPLQLKGDRACLKQAIAACSVPKDCTLRRLEWTPLQPSHGPLLLAVRRERRRWGHQQGGLLHLKEAW